MGKQRDAILSERSLMGGMITINDHLRKITWLPLCLCLVVSFSRCMVLLAIAVDQLSSSGFLAFLSFLVFWPRFGPFPPSCRRKSVILPPAYNAPGSRRTLVPLAIPQSTSNSLEVSGSGSRPRLFSSGQKMLAQWILGPSRCVFRTCMTGRSAQGNHRL